MFNIKFCSRDNTAELELTDNRFVWLQIRRLCEDKTTEVNNLGTFSLQLPWWVFTSLYNDIKYILELNSIEISIDEQTSFLLNKANKRKEQFFNRSAIASTSKKQMITCLGENNFERKLTINQLNNLKILAKLDAGATFSVPGAGKTTEALAYFFLKKQKDSKLLVIAPKNAFLSWESEFALCVPKTKETFTRLRGGRERILKQLKEGPDFCLITYQQLLTCSELIEQFLFKHPTFVFLDESHRIKGAGNKSTQIVLNLSHLPSNKLIMSGTPLPNDVSDLISQFNYLYPEIDTNAERIHEDIQGIYVRTPKSDLNLPNPNRKIINIPMLPSQSNLYNLLRSEEARQTKKILNFRDRNTLRRIGGIVMRLLQLCSNPALLLNVDFGHQDFISQIIMEGDSPKLQYACLRARQLAQVGKKTIIWTNFVQNVETIASRLQDLNAVYIHGGVDAGSEEEEDTREFKIKKFKEDQACFVFVANPAAASEGINLHNICTNAIYVDRNFNAAQYLQSEDRINRLGVPKNTKIDIEILVHPNSIDEVVNSRLITKVQNMANVLNDSSLRITPFALDVESEEPDDEDIQCVLNHLKSK